MEKRALGEGVGERGCGGACARPSLSVARSPRMPRGSPGRSAPSLEPRRPGTPSSSSCPALGRGWTTPSQRKRPHSGPRITRAARNPPSRLVLTLEQRGLSGGGVAEAGEVQSRNLANVLERLGDSVQGAQPSRCPLKVWGRPCPHKVLAWGERPPFGTPRLGPQTTQPGEARPEWPWSGLHPDGNSTGRWPRRFSLTWAQGHRLPAVHRLSGRKISPTPLYTNFHPVRLLTPKWCSGGKHVSPRTKGREEESD